MKARKGGLKEKREAKKEVDTSECQTVGWVCRASLFGRARGDTPVSSLHTHTHTHTHIRTAHLRQALVTPPALPIFLIHTRSQPRWQQQTVSRFPRPLSVPFLPITFHPAPPWTQGSIEDDSEDWMAVTEKAKDIMKWSITLRSEDCLKSVCVCVRPYYGSSVTVSVSLSWQVIINTLYLLDITSASKGD